MGYNAKVFEERAGLMPGLFGVGVVIQIADGVVKDFIQESAHDKWEGALDGRAINVKIEVIHNNLSYQFCKLLSYRLQDGKTIFSNNSNLGKYLHRYRKLPEVGDQVNVMTNADGFWRLVIE